MLEMIFSNIGAILPVTASAFSLISALVAVSIENKLKRNSTEERNSILETTKHTKELDEVLVEIRKSIEAFNQDYLPPEKAIEIKDDLNSLISSYNSLLEKLSIKPDDSSE